MKTNLLEQIFNNFNKIIIDENDNNIIKDIKNSLSGELLMIILLNLTVISKKLENLVLINFENIPEIYPDVVSSIHNPNCSCRGKVRKYFSRNYIICKDIFLKILGDPGVSEEQTEMIADIVESHLQKLNSYIKEGLERNLDLSGTILEIANNKEEFYKTIQKIKKLEQFYIGISIIENNDKLKLYFY